jgi:glycosyltransferase involved in cell wall biosynthesis
VKVFHIVHWARSGIGVLLRDLVTHRADDVEHVVMCLAPGKPVTDQIRAAGAVVYEPERALSLRESWRLFRQRVRADRANVVHTHSLTPRLLGAFGPSGIPTLTTIHAAYLYFHEKEMRAAVKRRIECFSGSRLTGPCICVAEDVARSLPCPALTSRAVVIMNGIDIARARAAAGHDPAPASGDPLLVAVGRLDWEKGFDRLLEAIASVRPHFPAVRLVICGDGVERQRLEALARQLELNDVVTFAGHVANSMPYFQAADAFISSSVQEGFALTAAEAMALGRPVIATPASGVGSVLCDGETAILASGFGAGDIASAILRAFSDRAQLQRVALSGRQVAESNLDVRRATAAYERIYRNLAQSRRA